MLKMKKVLTSTLTECLRGVVHQSLIPCTNLKSLAGRSTFTPSVPNQQDRVGIEGSEIEFLKTIGQHLVNKDTHKEVRDEESLFGDLIASQLRKMSDHDRLVTKMEINNLIYSRLMNSSSQEAINNTGYAATRYPEVANRVYSERQSITPQGAAHPLRLLSDLGNPENTQTFPRTTSRGTLTYI